MAEVGRVLATILEESHRMSAEALARRVRHHAKDLQINDVAIYLVDYDQSHLRPLERLHDESAPFAVDGTLGGRAYTSGVPVTFEQDGHDVVWLPLLDGTDRLGVARLQYETRRDGHIEEGQALINLVAELIVSKGQHSDFFFLARRRRNMELAAEMQWSLLPPLSHVTPEVNIAAALEPAYEVGGDVFDYALNYRTLHFALVDARGRGLNASILASAAIGSLRHSRRIGRVLVDAYGDVDSVITSQFDDDSFVTAQFGQLDCETGRMLWLNAGQPQPLLLRHGHVISELESASNVPPGIGVDEKRAQVNVEILEPGDRVFFFTDGVLEARVGGQAFGIDRIRDFLEQETSTGLSSSEITRRLTRAVLNHHDGTLQDDATMLLIEWPGPTAYR